MRPTRATILADLFSSAEHGSWTGFVEWSRYAFDQVVGRDPCASHRCRRTGRHLRMVISNRAHLPGIIFKGKESPSIGPTPSRNDFLQRRRI